MNVVIIYESLFGNTHEIADAVADGIRETDPQAQVTVVAAGQATVEQIEALDLLVVGGPTHMRGMSSSRSRRWGLEGQAKNAAQQGGTVATEPGAEGPGVRDWLEALPPAPKGSKAAVFDTRAGFRLAGGAGPKIARRLRRHGYTLAAKPEGFLIEDAQGPLRAGERDRARAWGAGLARQPAAAR